MAGPPAAAAASPVNTKIPAPIIAPIPSDTRFTAESERLSVCSPVSDASFLRSEIGLRPNRFAIEAHNVELVIESFSQHTTILVSFARVGNRCSVVDERRTQLDAKIRRFF